MGIKRAIFVLIIFSAWSAWAGEFDFRKTRWGMSESEVLKTEDGTPTPSGVKDVIGFTDKKMGGISTFVFYIFAQGKLVRAVYSFTEEYVNDNHYIDDYKKIKKILTEKYGKPLRDKMIWRNKLYQNRPQDWGQAVSIGHLTYHADWKTKKTFIRMTLRSKNLRVKHDLVYTSNELGQLLNQKRTGALIGKGRKRKREI